MPFSERFNRELANRYRLWGCRDLHRIPPVGIYQRRDHACFVRWFGLGFLFGNKSDLDGDAVLHPLRFWRGVGEQDAKRKGGFRHSGCMVAGYGFGSNLHFLTPGYAPNLSAYLFGNILTISTVDILWILGLVVLLILIFSLFLREIVYVAFDRDFAVTQGLPVKWIEYTMMCFIAMTIVLSIRLVGIMLLMSLLTLPQITVNLFTSDFKKIIWGSIAIGFLGCVSGLVLSYFLNVPSGAFIILFLVVLFLALKAIKPLLRR